MRKLTIAALLIAGSGLGLGVAPIPDDPYIVDLIIIDRTTNPITLEEIWSDHTTVIRPATPGDTMDYKCGASALCTNIDTNCRIIPQPATGVDCYYCTAGTANDTFCWHVATKACSRDGSSVTCGNKMEATCVIPAGGAPTDPATNCSGGTPALQGTCTLYGCS